MDPNVETFASLGKKIIKNGWGWSLGDDKKSFIKSMSDERMQLCLIARMVEQLDQCQNHLFWIEDRLPSKAKGHADPVADAYLQYLNLKAGDKLIEHMNLNELPTRLQSLIERDMRCNGLNRRSQITEESLKSNGWGPKYRKLAIEWAQKDSEKDQPHAG